MPNPTELKACPFCGVKNFEADNGWNEWIHPKNGCWLSEFSFTPEVWNSRHDETVEKTGEIREWLSDIIYALRKLEAMLGTSSVGSILATQLRGVVEMRLSLLIGESGLLGKTPYTETV